MNLSQLYYFRKLAELQHYTRAAKELYITQPTLSDAISSLEKELGLPLFTRDGRIVKLTDHGTEFYRYVCAGLHEIDTGVAAMKSRKDVLGGVINLGVVFTVQDDYLPVLLRAYREKFGSRVRIEIRQGFTNHLTQCLHDETIDVAFCGKIEGEPGLEYHPVLGRPLELCVHFNHPLADLDEITFDDLRTYRLVTYRRGTPIGEQVESTIAGYALEDIAQIYDDDITMASVVSVDDSVGAIMLNSVGVKLFSRIKMISIRDVPKKFYWVYATFSKKHFKSVALKSFIEFVKEHNIECVDFGRFAGNRVDTEAARSEGCNEV